MESGGGPEGVRRTCCMPASMSFLRASSPSLLPHAAGFCVFCPDPCANPGHVKSVFRAEKHKRLSGPGRTSVLSLKSRHSLNDVRPPAKPGSRFRGRRQCPCQLRASGTSSYRVLSAICERANAGKICTGGQYSSSSYPGGSAALHSCTRCPRVGGTDTSLRLARIGLDLGK